MKKKIKKDKAARNPPITTKAIKFTLFTLIPKMKMIIAIGNWPYVMTFHEFYHE